MSDRLTQREQQVVTLIADGLTNDQVAARLNITADTVHAHLVKAARRAGTTSRAALVHWAWRHNYLGDRAQLLEQIEALTNTVDNLRAMYATAVGFKDFQP